MRRLYLKHAGLAVAALIGMTTAAEASSGDPLVLGDVVGFNMDPPAMATTADGATWVAWPSDQCFGALRLQRIDDDDTLLVPGGLELNVQPGCTLFEAAVAACSDNSVVTASRLLAEPVQRIDANGVSMWGPGIVVSPIGTVGDVLGLPGGDALVAWHQGFAVFVGRYGPDGTPVWTQPATIPTNSGRNKRIIALLPDDADGAYVLWDTPSTYTRSISMARVSATGHPAWNEPLNVVPIDGPPSFSGSSRHTDPVAIEDGAGGVALAWTFGAETGTTPVPVLLQIVRPDGSRVFEPAGRRVSLRSLRQFNAGLVRDPVSGDVFVTWRDGGFDAQSLYAQRVTPDGTRLWSDDGVAVSALGIGGVSHFGSSWSAGTLSLLVSDVPAPGEPSVVLHRLDGNGVTAGAPTSISIAVPTGAVGAIPAGHATSGAVMVAWLEQPVNGEVRARRVCDGPCALVGDATGDGQVNVDDLVAVIVDWGTDGSANGGDVDDDGTVDVNDLVLVIVSWTE